MLKVGDIVEYSLLEELLLGFYCRLLIENVVDRWMDKYTVICGCGESINGAVLCVGETRWGSCAQGVVPVDIEKRERGVSKVDICVLNSGSHCVR